MRHERQLLISHRFWLRHAGNMACGGAVLLYWLAPELPLYVGGMLAVIGITVHAAASVQKRGEIAPLLADAVE